MAIGGRRLNGRRVLVLGATSLVGRFLTPKLVRAGVRPLALSRTPRSGDGVDWIAGDLQTAAPLLRSLSIGTVYSVSPIWLLPNALPALIDAGAQRVIAFSSTSLVTKMASPVASERSVAGRLASSEEAVIELCDEAGIGWTILRPTLIYAEGLDGNVSRLAKIIQRMGVLPLAGRGEGLRQPVHAEDLAIAAIAASASPGAVGNTYDLPGGETLAYRAMVERVFEGLGRRPLIVSVPTSVWSLAFALAKPLLPGATAAMGSRMSEDLTFDSAPAQRDFRWAPRPFHPDFKRTQPS
jgi:nucleoside-diphosphate-sugar epimerase